MVEEWCPDDHEAHDYTCLVLAHRAFLRELGTWGSRSGVNPADLHSMRPMRTIPVFADPQLGFTTAADRA